MLAFETTGKYVSERHAEAKAAGNLTAGQMAAKLSKFAGEKITAAELKPLANEWHHSGFYRGNHGSTMGRTYFFNANTDLQTLYERVKADRLADLQIAAEPEIERYFFCTEFERSERRHRWSPLANFKAALLKSSSRPDFKYNEEISKEDYENFKQFTGKYLESYESFFHFKERLTVCAAASC